jgi:hypothetical protein
MKKTTHKERNKRLSETDYLLCVDYPISAEMKQKWLDYRQTLRDLPANTQDPLNPTFPETPTQHS